MDLKTIDDVGWMDIEELRNCVIHDAAPPKNDKNKSSVIEKRGFQHLVKLLPGPPDWRSDQVLSILPKGQDGNSSPFLQGDQVFVGVTDKHPLAGPWRECFARSHDYGMTYSIQFRPCHQLNTNDQRVSDALKASPEKMAQFIAESEQQRPHLAVQTVRIDTDLELEVAAVRREQFRELFTIGKEAASSTAECLERYRLLEFWVPLRFWYAQAKEWEQQQQQKK
jgi:hypothetical protein